jgi:hypothetical protein
MEGQGSPSNQEEHPASPVVADAAATSSSLSSSSESGKISGLDGSASSRESGSSTSTSNSDASSDSDSGGDVEIVLSNTDAKKRVADIEEGEIDEGTGAAAAAEESGENLAGMNAGPQDLVKPSTCCLGRSLMTQANLDAMVLEGCFASGTCRLPGRETTLKPRKNESVVFRDFVIVGLRLPVSKRFANILVAYMFQIHQLTPNSFPQIMKFLWACRTFAGDNDVETFIRQFEIHWAKRVVTIDDEDK